MLRQIPTGRDVRQRAGVYKLPAVKSFAPTSLAQRATAASFRTAGRHQPFDFVFHGGSGSLKSEIEALRYGVVKMNVDTDTQYAFTARSPVTCSPTTTGAQGRWRVGVKRSTTARYKKAEAS